MAAALENELEVDNEDYYSLLNVRREVKWICFEEEHNSSVLSRSAQNEDSNAISLIR